MATATKTIDAEVLEQVAAGSWVDGGFVMPQMDPRLYQKVKKVLLAIGGKWNRSRQATLFDTDGETSVREAVMTGEYTDLKKLYQAFNTPDDVIVQMMKTVKLTGCLDLPDSAGRPMKALEPSAGTGNIARRLRDYGAAVWTIEIQPELCEKLRADGFDNSCLDFLTMAGTFDYDLVAMNPPFTDSQDIMHVMHAYNFVKPGGTLVSVMSPGFTFRSDKKARAFREWLEAVGGGYTFLPDDSFSDSGTKVRTVLVSIHRPLV